MANAVLISATDLDALMRSASVVLIDTRDAAQFAEAHIPGAVNMREVFTYLATSSPEGLGKLNEMFADAFGRAGLSGAETAVIYEQSMDTGFGQSCRGYVLLRHLGYPNIKVLHGGYAAWRAAGLPSTSDATTPTQKAFKIRTDVDEVINSMCATWMSGSARVPPPTGVTSARARDEFLAPSGLNGIE